MHTIRPFSLYWEDVYHANLLQAFIAPDMELINHTFELPAFRHVADQGITNPARGFRWDFSKLMAEWVLSGETVVSEAMRKLNPNAAKFATVLQHDKYGYHNTAYGVRVKRQLDHVINELRRDSNSRRACIMMLADTDQDVAAAMAEGESKCEYICTYAFNFRLRGGFLDMHVSMRSNNYTTTVCQDVYVFAELQKAIAQKLDVPNGSYYHHTVSGHIVKGEEARAAEILRNYCDAYTAVYGPAAWPEAGGWKAGWTAFVGKCLELGIEVS